MWRLQAAARHRKVSTLFLDFFSLQDIYKLTLTYLYEKTRICFVVDACL